MEQSRLAIWSLFETIKGADIWSPVTLYYEITKASDSVLQNRKTFIHEYNIKGILNCLQCEQITLKVRDEKHF